jgi:hypothetical protein
MKAYIAMGLVTLSWMNVPQTKNQSKSKPQPTATVSISGTSFDEKHFVSDVVLKLWTVTNPNVLEGYACEHVRITGQLNTANNTIVVKTIKVVAAPHEMPSNDDYQLTEPPSPFPIR